MQAELAHLVSPKKDLWLCPSRMNSIKMTLLTLEAKKKNVCHISSGKYVLGRGQKGEVSWRWWGVFFFFPLSSSVCGVCRLIETCPASHLPLTYIPGTGGSHLATSIAQYPQFPCRWSPKECSSAQREKWTYRLVQQDELLSSSEAEKNLLFLLFCFSLQHFVIFENTQEHQRYFQSLLLFSCNMSWGKEKNEVETTKQQIKIWLVHYL